ncbi:NAD(P)/FAD-dependent oxidoreductase [Streptomyces acidicola]|uniref:Ferredoxin reductase n=1 Tax=Streptomyces acidicola TaxID=2596892 RepID=A0A5N8WJR3_9ACTN|nr:FAD-dependent oxidoreductase [Streptomyces acidicola]MPY47489.1 ferredoxin reductase [Streptomyces acidicola]
MSAGHDDIIIVGAGLAGVRTAQTLRDLGHTGRIRLYSEETEPPYDRPPLSKGFLTGSRGDEAIRFQAPGDYVDQRIELVLGAHATALDPRSRTLGFADGTETGYGRLVVATGARPRELPVLPASTAVHYLRTAADARRLGAALGPGRRVTVVGGGFIGLEVACAALSLGGSVTVLEVAALPLAGVVGATAARWVCDWHLARGMTFRTGVTVTGAYETAGAQVLRLDDGSEVVADVVVVGVGVVRDTEWLSAAGLEVHHGLVCDRTGRTGTRDVFGTGDVMCLHDDAGCRLLGHWTAAADSAARVAEAVVLGDVGGGVEAAEDDGFFWSDQGSLRLQFAGHIGADVEITVVGDGRGGDAVVVHYKSRGRLAGVFAANSPRAFLRGRAALRSAGAIRTTERSTL